MSQLRGTSLTKAIRSKLLELANKHGEKYVYNCSELSRELNVSRVTLNKYDKVIEEFLDEICVSKRFSNGQGAAQFMQEKIQKQQCEIDNLRKEIIALRNHHTEIYKKLYYSSENLASLVKPILLDESISLNYCILCNNRLDLEEAQRNINIIDITSRKPKSEKQQNT